VEMQGNLAELSKQDFERLRKSLISEGFTYAISVWENPDTGEKKLLDGHARVRTCKHLVEDDGFVVEPLPAVIVQAASERAARKKLLLGRSEYHKTTKQGLYEFLHESSIEVAEVKDVVKFSTLDMDDFVTEFYGDDNPTDPSEDLSESFSIKCKNNRELTMLKQLLKVSKKSMTYDAFMARLASKEEV